MCLTCNGAIKSELEDEKGSRSSRYVILICPNNWKCIIDWYVFAPYGFSNKLSQTWWLETTEMYSLTDLDARSPKPESSDWNQGVGRATLPSAPVGENPFTVSSCFQWLLTFLGLWPHHSNLQGQHLQIFFYSFFPLFLLLLGLLSMSEISLCLSL